jgi:HEAT repeat protein
VNAPIDHKAVMDAMAETLHDTDARVRRTAIVALTSRSGRHAPPEPLAEGLKDESAANRAAAIGGLAVYGQGLDPWLPALLAIAEHDPDPAVREGSLRILKFAFKPPALTAAAVPALIAGMGSKDAKVRSLAAETVGLLRADARAAIPDLLRMLNEPPGPDVTYLSGPQNFDTGCAAASALGRIAPESARAKEVIRALIDVARSGPTGRHGWAAYSLGEFGPVAEEAVPTLIEVLRDASPDGTREREAFAAMALGRIAPGTPLEGQAFAALLPVLQSKSSFSQASALDAVRHFGPRVAAALPRIRKLTSDPDPEVRNAASKALRAIERGDATGASSH